MENPFNDLLDQTVRSFWDWENRVDDKRMNQDDPNIDKAWTMGVAAGFARAVKYVEDAAGQWEHDQEMQQKYPDYLTELHTNDRVRLASFQITEELADILTQKKNQYNQNRPDYEKINLQKAAALMLEYAIRCQGVEAMEKIRERDGIISIF